MSNQRSWSEGTALQDEWVNASSRLTPSRPCHKKRLKRRGGHDWGKGECGRRKIPQLHHDSVCSYKKADLARADFNQGETRHGSCVVVSTFDLIPRAATSAVITAANSSENLHCNIGKTDLNGKTSKRVHNSCPRSCDHEHLKDQLCLLTLRCIQESIGRWWVVSPTTNEHSCITLQSSNTIAMITTSTESKNWRGDCWLGTKEAT
jgi:hypothetical protein